MFSGMLNRGRGNSSNRGNRGRGNTPRQKHSGYILAQNVSQKLIAADLSGSVSELSNTEIDNISGWKQIQRTNIPSSSNPSFSTIVQNNSLKEDEMLPNEEERIILLLSETDKKWEDKPWLLFDRYLGGHGYTMESYKPRHYYETILSSNGCTIDHFTGTNKEIYNFSKIIIGQVISMTDWGISPVSEKTLIIRGATVKYNYWDYIQAFDKVFLYENDKRSHTWFIKISSEVYNDCPNWMIKWWRFYGTSENILPSFIQEYFHEWKKVIPSNQDNKIIPESMRFFIEFSIPWIWRTSPTTGYNNGLFCLKRRSYSRFWEKMTKKDEKGELYCLPTIELIKGKIDSYKSLKAIEEKQYKEREKARLLEILDDEESMDIQEVSKEQIIKAYMEGLRKTLKLKEEGGKDKQSSKSDTSMASDHSQSSYSALLQDAQDPEDDSDFDKIITYLQGEK